MLKHLLIYYGFSLLFFSLISGTLSAQECGIFYVTPSGNVTGTPQSPCSLSFALQNISSQNNVVRLAVGRYNLTHALGIPAGAHLEGGFDPADDWKKSSSGVTHLFRNNQNPELNPLRLVAFKAERISDFSLRELTIETESADTLTTGFGASLYGIYLNSCSNYHISRCKIINGNATEGEKATAPAAARNGANGSDGGKGCRQCDEIVGTDFHNRGGNGGNAWSGGIVAGGNGGNGGTRGDGRTLTVFPPQLSLCPPVVNGQSSVSGQNGAIPYPFPPAEGGPRGTDRDWTSDDASIGVGCSLTLSFLSNIITNGVDWLQNCPTNSLVYFGQDGKNGMDGARAGRDGRNGSIAWQNGFFIPGDATDGEAGYHGAGGGGGGGGGAIQNVPKIREISAVSQNWGSPGAGGGGGGEGGEGGPGGKGGKGGGANFGIFIWDNGTNGFIRNCEIQLGNAGKGTQGTKGATGAKGGIGGKGGYDCDEIGSCASGCEGGRGGNGGNGGNGAEGGNGGNGADGIRQNLYQNFGGDPINAGSFNTVFLPNIAAHYSGYTHSQAVFKVTDPDPTATYSWNFEGINQTYSGTEVITFWKETGYKNVVLTVNGVAYNYTAFVKISKELTLPVLQSNPNSDQICKNDGLTLNIIPDGNDPVEDYFWEFKGQGLHNTDNQPSFTIPTLSIAGKYTIKATVKHRCAGWSDTVYKEIEVIEPLNPSVALFSLSNDKICEGTPIRLRTQVFQAGNQYTLQYLLNNQEITTTTLEGVILYDQPLAPGRHTFSVSLLPATTCLSITPPIKPAQEVVIEVVPNPTLNCTDPAPVKLGEETTFNFNISNASLPVSYEMNMGNGQTINGTSNTNSINQKGRYGSAGTFNVTIKIIDANGCQAVCKVAAEVKSESSIGEADFKADTPTEGCDELTVTFSSQTEGKEYRWNFGDGSEATTQEPTVTHTFVTGNNRESIFTVRLSVVNDQDLVLGPVEKENMVKVYPKPSAKIILASSVVCIGQPMLFSNDGKGATSFEWDFGDGFTSNQPAPFHTYTAKDDFQVKLKVTNFNGLCTDEAEITVSPFYVPEPDFDADKKVVCLPAEVTFTNKTINNNGANVLTYRWDFGDGTVKESTEMTLKHTYTSEGTFSPRLTVITVEGCEKSIDKRDFIKVGKKTDARLEVNDNDVSDGATIETVAGEEIRFKGTASEAEKLFWLWNGQEYPTKGDTTIGFSFSEQPVPFGFIAGTGDCRDTVKIFLKIIQSDEVSIPNVFSPNGDGQNDLFNIIQHKPLRFTLEIFDRWGTLVYRGDQSSTGWNGQVHNSSSPCPEGAYVYHLHILPDETAKIRTESHRVGTVVIIR